MTLIRRLLNSSLLIAACICSITANTTIAKQPNVILILADDLGVDGLNCYGGTTYRTPRLDKLATEGLRFTHAYAQPLCTNTRIQLMTGLYNNRNWLYFGCLDPSAKTIGHYMQDAGYHTCIAGKWQLHSYDPPDYPGAELRRSKGMKIQDAGFDEYSGWHVGHTEDKGYRYADPVIFQNGEFIKDTKGKYGEDIWVDFITDYMTRHKESEKPFFVYYPMCLPHWPFVPTPNSEDWGVEDKMHPPLGTTGGDTKYFGDMVNYMDEVVGRIVDKVDSLGLAEDTMIIYFSDNGTDRRVVSQTIFGSVTGGKGSTSNAGTHVPLIVRWKGTIQPGINENLVDSTDILPTVLHAAQRPVPPAANLDGISFFPQLLNQAGPIRPWVFCHYDPRPGWDKDKFTLHRFVRDKEFKLYDDGNLYDITKDIRESTPIRRRHETEASKAARQKLQQVLDDMRSN